MDCEALDGRATGEASGAESQVPRMMAIIAEAMTSPGDLLSKIEAGAITLTEQEVETLGAIVESHHNRVQLVGGWNVFDTVRQTLRDFQARGGSFYAIEQATGVRRSQIGRFVAEDPDRQGSIGEEKLSRICKFLKLKLMPVPDGTTDVRSDTIEEFDSLLEETKRGAYRELDDITKHVRGKLREHSRDVGEYLLNWTFRSLLAGRDRIRAGWPLRTNTDQGAQEDVACESPPLPGGEGREERAD